MHGEESNQTTIISIFPLCNGSHSRVISHVINVHGKLRGLISVKFATGNKISSNSNFLVMVTNLLVG